MADEVTLTAHSGDTDRTYIASNTANGELALGAEASMLCRSWRTRAAREVWNLEGSASKTYARAREAPRPRMRIRKANSASPERLPDDLMELRR